MVVNIGKLIDGAGKLAGKFVQDADKRAALAAEIQTMAERHAHEVAIEQIKLNQVQAASKFWFVAGARPAIMWVGALGFFWMTMGRDFVMAMWPGTVLPDPNNTLLIYILTALLGIPIAKDTVWPIAQGAKRLIGKR